MDNSVPVVVINGRGGHGALGVARSLGRFRIPTYLISGKRPYAVGASRYWTKRFDYDFSGSPIESLDFMLDVGRKIGRRSILLALPDWGAVFIEDNAEALGQHFILPKAAPPLVRRLTNKWEMFLIAKEHGIPTPETVAPRCRAEVLSFLETAQFPIMMKGADQMLPGAKAKEIIHDRRHLLEQYDLACAAGEANLIFQEYIPGGEDSVWMCNAYFGAGSKCFGAYTARKLRQYPPYTGVASLAVCIANDAVEQLTIQFMQSVGYEGLLDVGYRYDARDGRYKVLDVNPRVGGCFRLFRASNGLDVVRMCYLDLTGQPIPPSPPSFGRKWLLEEDLESAVRYARDGKLTFRQWLGSLRGVQELHYFAIDDPSPILVWLYTKGSAGFGAALRRIPRFERGQLPAKA